MYAVTQCLLETLVFCRILQEEFERREQLEKMRADLEKLLQEEQLRNTGLEEIRMKQEVYIQEEQQKLEALEKERERQEQEHLVRFLSILFPSFSKLMSTPIRIKFDRTQIIFR